MFHATVVLLSCGWPYYLSLSHKKEINKDMHSLRSVLEKVLGFFHFFSSFFFFFLLFFLALRRSACFLLVPFCVFPWMKNGWALCGSKQLRTTVTHKRSLSCDVRTSCLSISCSIWRRSSQLRMPSSIVMSASITYSKEVRA